MKFKINAVIAFLTGLLLISLLIVFTSDTPFSSLYHFFSKPFTSKWHFGNMLNHFAMLLFAGCGAFFAFQTQNLNLGGEGQIYISGLLTALLFKTSWQIPAPLQFSVVLIIICVISGFIGFISGYLKMKYNITEILTSFLISSAILPVTDYLISNPLRDNTSNLLGTAPINESFRLTKIFPPSNLSPSFFIAILITVMLSVLLNYTRFGYKLKTSGIAPEFAQLAGFNYKFTPVVGMSVSAMLYGMAGFFAITGTWSICHLGFSNGMGWSGLAIGLMSGSSFYSVIPATFIYAWIDSAASAGILSGLFKFNTAIFLQAVILLIISAKLFSRKEKCKH
ncbi:MAG: branched-chain amino acid ABC transporter permease [Treponema sp.]|nr:MAG: branched-chain amino acid ABC transporter permease [Treponema sp.]